MNLAVLYLQEKGELKKLEDKWWYDRGQCDVAGNVVRFRGGMSAGAPTTFPKGRLIDFVIGIGGFLVFESFEGGGNLLHSVGRNGTDDFFPIDYMTRIHPKWSEALDSQSVTQFPFLQVLSMVTALVEFLFRKRLEQRDNEKVLATIDF